MKLNRLLWRPYDEGELIASFGEARLVKKLDGRIKILGGTPDARASAHLWIYVHRNHSPDTAGLHVKCLLLDGATPFIGSAKFNFPGLDTNFEMGVPFTGARKMEHQPVPAG